MSNQDRLRLYDLTISDVVEAAGGAHSTASGGYLVNVDNFEMPDPPAEPRHRRQEDIAIDHHQVPSKACR